MKSISLNSIASKTALYGMGLATGWLCWHKSVQHQQTVANSRIGQIEPGSSQVTLEKPEHSEKSNPQISNLAAKASTMFGKSGSSLLGSDGSLSSVFCDMLELSESKRQELSTLTRAYAVGLRNLELKNAYVEENEFGQEIVVPEFSTEALQAELTKGLLSAVDQSVTDLLLERLEYDPNYSSLGFRKKLSFTGDESSPHVRVESTYRIAKGVVQSADGGPGISPFITHVAEFGISGNERYSKLLEAAPVLPMRKQ